MHTQVLNLIQLIKLLEGIRRRPTGIMNSREALHSLKRTTSLLEKLSIPDKNNLNENQLIRHLSWHIYPSSKDRLQRIQCSMQIKSCPAANGILPVPSFQLHTTHKSTRTQWSQSYEDIPRGQTGNRRNGYRISVQYADLKKNTWMKTLI